MSLILDLACIILIWIFAAKGYKKGIVKGLFGLVSFVASGIITAVVYKPVSEYIISVPFIKDKIVLIEEKITQFIAASQQDSVSRLPDWLLEIAGETINETNLALSSSVTNILVSVLCIVIVYLLVKLALRLFEGVLEIIMKLPVLNLLNHAGGTVCGVVSSVIVLWLVLAVAVLFAATPVFTSINEVLQSTNILKYFYNNNLLIKLIIK